MANAIRIKPPMKCEQNIVKWFMYMYTLDGILDGGLKFQNRMFQSFPQFVYCSRDEEYFPKSSCLFSADGGTLHGQHVTVAMRHIHDVTKTLMT